MSEGYATERALVGAESNGYDRALDATIAHSVVTFLLGLLTLVKVVPLSTSGAALAEFFLFALALGVGAVGAVGLVSYLDVAPVTSRRVRGVGLGLLVDLVGLAALTAAVDLSMATLLGVLLVLAALAVGVAGVASWFGAVDTEPSASPGLLAGAAFGLVGVLVGAALGGTLLGGSSIAYYGSAVVVGFGFAALSILPREDVGTALPSALLVGLLGVVVATGTVGLGWTWQPGPRIDGAFTGGVVVPLFALLGSIVSSWAAAKGRAGYGARGRQYGAYIAVYLNAVLMVAIMVAIVAFVTMKGLNYALHGFTIGAVSAVVVLTPLTVLAIDFARRKAGTPGWHAGARQFVRVAPLAAIGSLVSVLAVLQVTGEALTIPFTYTVWIEGRQANTLDSGLSIVTDPTVGTLLVVLVGLFLVWYFLRRYGSLRGVGTHRDRVASIERLVGLGLGGLVILSIGLVLGGQSPFGVPVGGTIGAPLVLLLSFAGLGLAVAPLAALLLGDGDVVHRARDRAQVVRVGAFGGLGVLLATAIFEPIAGATPMLGTTGVVPLAATVAALASLAVAAVTAATARSASAGDTRVLHRESALGLALGAGFVVVAAVHVALTGSAFSLGPLTIGYTGTLSWPMAMEAYIPLGAEPGGILPAVVGTVWLVVGAAVFAVPLGVGAAVFLTEYAEQGRFTALVEVATNALWSTPSVVFGLFGAAFLIPRLGSRESLLAGMLVLGFMLLPLVLITSREAVKSVPDEYRDASAALGVNRWETIKSVVLPAALPGVITGVILGVGRVAGETAPLILVMSGTLNSTQALDVLGGFRFVAEPPFVYNPALLEATAALPTQVWAVIAAGVSGSPSMGWASALILLMVVLTFYAVGITARTYFRRKLTHE